MVTQLPTGNFITGSLLPVFNHFIFIAVYYPAIKICHNRSICSLTHPPFDGHWVVFFFFLLFCYCKHSKTHFAHISLCTHVRIIWAFVVGREVAGLKDMNDVWLYVILPGGFPDERAAFTPPAPCKSSPCLTSLSVLDVIITLDGVKLIIMLNWHPLISA